MNYHTISYYVILYIDRIIAVIPNTNEFVEDARKGARHRRRRDGAEGDDHADGRERRFDRDVFTNSFLVILLYYLSILGDDTNEFVPTPAPILGRCP